MGTAVSWFVPVGDNGDTQENYGEAQIGREESHGRSVLGAIRNALKLDHDRQALTLANLLKVVQDCLTKSDETPIAWVADDKVSYLDEMGERPLPGGWLHGRVFGTRGELRWERRGNWAHVVLVTDEDLTPETLPGEDSTRERERPKDAPGGVVLYQKKLPTPTGERFSAARLWGGRQPDDGTWREGRIPLALPYPVGGTRTRVWVEVQTYRDTETKDLIFVRYAGLTTQDPSGSGFFEEAG